LDRTRLRIVAFPDIDPINRPSVCSFLYPCPSRPVRLVTRLRFLRNMVPSNATQTIGEACNKLLKPLGCKVVRLSSDTVIPTEKRGIWNWVARSEELPNELLGFVVSNFSSSFAQAQQDLLVLSVLGTKRDGFFVEFGATDGRVLSNTLLLERDFGWRGILAEPGKLWHERLRRNRPNTTLDFRCVWSESGQQIAFNETVHGEHSTIESFSRNDLHTSAREGGSVYLVQTVSLVDLLEEHNAPATVDYLSVDTEGSEFEILASVDFDRYTFRVITCEHNFTPQREKIYNLLSGKGYRRVLTSVSRFDDWYIHESVQTPYALAES
jgi:FkbM family methyltransferase